MNNSSMKPYDLTAGRALRQFPDYQLDTIYPICWPVYRVRLTATVLKKGNISTTANYILRLVDNGVSEQGALERLLCLPKQYIVSAAAELLRAGLVEQSQDLRLGLTDKGQDALSKDGEIVRPQAKQMEIPFDPLTRKVPDISVKSLLNQEKVDSGDLFVVQYTGPKPGSKDLRLEEIKRYKNRDPSKSFTGDDIISIPDVKNRDPSKSFTGDDIISISDVKSRNVRLQYRGGIVIVKLSRPDTGVVIFLVYRQHEYLKDETDSLQRLTEHGVNLVPGEFKHGNPLEGSASPMSSEENDLLKEIEELDLKADKARQQAAQAETDKSTQESLRRGEPAPNAIRLEERQLDEQLAGRKAELNKLTGGTIRLIKTEKHHALLLAAIEQAAEELILVSAWVGPHAFDAEVRKKIAAAVERGVTVRVAWGLGVDDRHVESVRNRKKGEKVFEMLRKIIKNNARKRLIIKRTNTHEKFIICDDLFCAWGSFNWLSYRGDIDQGYRRETSMYSTRPDDIRLWKENADSLFQNESAE